jgi:hypothetical protein
MPRSRRSLLEAAGLALGGGALATLAGCTSTSPTGGASSPAGSSPTDEPTPADGTTESVSVDLAQWLPNPASSPFRDGYGVRTFDIAALRRHREAMHENAYRRLEREMLYPAPDRYVDAADIAASVGVGDARVAIGSFDPDAIGERITSDGDSSTPTAERTPTTPTRTPWSEPEQYEGFDLYGTEYVYAVSEDVLMEVPPMRPESDGAGPYAKAIIDAGAGETGHYADGNAYVDAMLGTVDDPHALWCYPEAMDGSTTRGFRADEITGGLKSWRFGTETTHLTFANTYADAEAAEAEKLASYIESESDRFGPYDGLDVEASGRLVWTDGDIPTGEFDHLSAGGPEDGVRTPN